MAIVGVASALWSASGYVGAFTGASRSIKPLRLLVTFVCGPLATAGGEALGLGDAAVTGKWPVMLPLVPLILHGLAPS